LVTQQPRGEVSQIVEQEQVLTIVVGDIFDVTCDIAAFYGQARAVACDSPKLIFFEAGVPHSRCHHIPHATDIVHCNMGLPLPSR
jgi:hypothetical protein